MRTPSTGSSLGGRAPVNVSDSAALLGGGGGGRVGQGVSRALTTPAQSFAGPRDVLRYTLAMRRAARGMPHLATTGRYQTYTIFRLRARNALQVGRGGVPQGTRDLDWHPTLPGRGGGACRPRGMPYRKRLVRVSIAARGAPGTRALPSRGARLDRSSRRRLRTSRSCCSAPRPCCRSCPAACPPVFEASPSGAVEPRARARRSHFRAEAEVSFEANFKAWLHGYGSGHQRSKNVAMRTERA